MSELIINDIFGAKMIETQWFGLFNRICLLIVPRKHIFYWILSECVLRLIKENLLFWYICNYNINDILYFDVITILHMNFRKILENLILLNLA